MAFFEKTLKEYLLPVKFHILGMILVVISQYTIALPLLESSPLILNMTQWLWEILVVLALFKLIRTYSDFNIKNILFSGILFAIIIHGLKVSIRFVFYGRDFPYLVDRFVYGTILVMAVTIAVAMLFYFKKKKWI